MFLWWAGLGHLFPGVPRGMVIFHLILLQASFIFHALLCCYSGGCGASGSGGGDWVVCRGGIDWGAAEASACGFLLAFFRGSWASSSGMEFWVDFGPYGSFSWSLFLVGRLYEFPGVCLHLLALSGLAGVM